MRYFCQTSVRVILHSCLSSPAQSQTDRQTGMIVLHVQCRGSLWMVVEKQAVVMWRCELIPANIKVDRRREDGAWLRCAHHARRKQDGSLWQTVCDRCWLIGCSIGASRWVRMLAAVMWLLMLAL